MKRLLYYSVSFLAASIAFAACNSTRLNEDVPEVGVKVLTAHTDSDVATRTSLSGKSVIWLNSDKITAFTYSKRHGGLVRNYSSTGTEVSQDGKVAKFTFRNISISDDVLMALYPENTSATMDGNMIITTEIPVEQSAVANSFAIGANVAIAKGEGTDELKFRNAGAIVSFTLQNNNVKSVKLSALDETSIAGPCTVAIDEYGYATCSPKSGNEEKSVTLLAPGDGCFATNTRYYFVILPGGYSGFRLEFTSSDGKTAKLKNGTAADIISNDNYNFGTIPDLSSKWKTPAPVWETTYALFASDRHGNENAFSTATRNIPVAVPYVCLIGDMVGNGEGDNPWYQSSTVKNEVTPKWPTATVDIVWGSHDAGVYDDAHIVKCSTAGSSGLIHTAYDSNGNVQYYVYGVAYYDMGNTNYGNLSANAFKAWVNGISDRTIPIFVVCHMPIHAARGDNYGAYYWNRAITYAATGSETGRSVSRNVVFIHGHNHTNEYNQEYYYAPGSTITVARSGGNVNCVIPYTYITGGYLNANKKATLVSVSADTIDFTKYGSSSAIALGSVARIKD